MKESKQQQLPSGVVSLHQLTVVGLLGCEPDEKIQEQPIILDIDYAPKSMQCAYSDSLDDAIDYNAVSETCREVIRGAHFHLLEALGTALAQALIEKFPIRWIRLRVQKINPMPFLASTSAEIVLPHDVCCCNCPKCGSK